jgi:hypothetical protein
MRSAVIEHAIRAIPPLERALAQTEAAVASRRTDVTRSRQAFDAAREALEAAVRRRDSIKAAYWLDRISDWNPAQVYSEEDMKRINDLLKKLATDIHLSLGGVDLTGLIGTWNPLEDALRAVNESERRRDALGATRRLFDVVRRDEGAADKLLDAVRNRDAALLERLLGTGPVRIDQGLLAARAMKLVFTIGNLRQCFAVTPLCDGNTTYGIQ